MSDEDTPLSPSAQAALYNNLSGLQFKDACLLINEILKPQTGESILDLGCGTGRAAMVLASRVGPSGRIIGVDPNKSRVEVARETLDKSDFKHVSFMVGTCADAISKGLFDVIFSNYVLHWIQDHDLILQDAYRCLRSGGRFAFHTPVDVYPLLGVLIKGLFGSVDAEAIFGLKFGNKDYWINKCTEAGFTVEFIEEKESPHTFSDPLSVMHLVRATIPFRLPKTKKEDVVKWLKPFTDENTGRVSFSVLNVRALLRKP
jgi:SAM-dependent methyltransferase